jgi:hypothetical protein
MICFFGRTRRHRLARSGHSLEGLQGQAQAKGVTVLENERPIHLCENLFPHRCAEALFECLQNFRVRGIHLGVGQSFF